MSVIFLLISIGLIVYIAITPGDSTTWYACWGAIVSAVVAGIIGIAPLYIKRVSKTEYVHEIKDNEHWAKAFGVEDDDLYEFKWVRIKTKLGAEIVTRGYWIRKKGIYIARDDEGNYYYA